MPYRINDSGDSICDTIDVNSSTTIPKWYNDVIFPKPQTDWTTGYYGGEYLKDSDGNDITMNSPLTTPDYSKQYTYGMEDILSIKIPIQHHFNCLDKYPPTQCITIQIIIIRIMNM